MSHGAASLMVSVIAGFCIGWCYYWLVIRDKARIQNEEAREDWSTWGLAKRAIKEEFNKGREDARKEMER